jgi:hypothetical protein
MYDGTVLFHLYDELVAPKPIFTTFLEGALHVAEVARSHPSYASAHFHEAYDQARAIDCEPHAYFNMTLFSCAPETLWDAFEDLRECMDIAHVERTHHALPCAEIAAIPGPTSAIASAPHGAARYAETDATVLVATPRGGGGDGDEDAEKVKAAWEAWSGADAARAACGATFLGASLHECVDASSAYRFVARTELGGASDEAVKAATEAARAAAGDGAIVGAYRCAFNIEKEGAPAGALPAVREVQKKQREAKEQGFKSAAA